MNRTATATLILIASTTFLMGCGPQKTTYSGIGEGSAPALSIDAQAAADFEAPTSIAASIRKTRIALEESGIGAASVMR